MFGSEYSTDDYKSQKISIGVIMNSREMLKFVLGHLKTKMMSKHAVKKLVLVIRYDPDRCKTQEMCNKAIIENEGVDN